VPKLLAPASAAAHTPTRASSNIQAVGVVILARNQAQAIARCISGLFAANSYSGWHTSLWIVVVAGGCSDDTAKTARIALGAFGQVLEISARSADAAHRLGASVALEHFRTVPRHALLLTSAEASAELPRDWIDVQLRFSQSPIGLTSGN
jgi:hypothetical protein